MRVLHLVKTSVGAAWALKQMRELVKLGVEVHVALPFNGPLIEKYKEYGITTHSIDYSVNPIRLFRCLTNLRRLVKEVKPDIIHSHFVITSLISRVALVGFKTPRIFQVPGPLHLEHRLYRLMDIKTANKHDYWVGSCSWTVDRYIKSGISPNRLFLSYYGNDLSIHIHQKGKLRKELHISSSSIVVGMVAFMYAPKKWLGQKVGIKGHEDFIDAIAILLNKHKNITPVCIGGAWNGDSWYEEQVKKYARLKCDDRVIFLGTRHDISELYPDIDIVIHPSHTENLGGAAESLMLGIPTIASNVGGFPDIIEHQVTGLLVEPKNPKQLAETIDMLLETPKKRQYLAANGKERVKSLLNITTTAKTMHDIYLQILKERV